MERARLLSDLPSLVRQRFAQDYKVVIHAALRSLSKDQKLSLDDLIFTSVEDEDTVKRDCLIRYHPQGDRGAVGL